MEKFVMYAIKKDGAWWSMIHEDWFDILTSQCVIRYRQAAHDEAKRLNARVVTLKVEVTNSYKPE